MISAVPVSAIADPSPPAWVEGVVAAGCALTSVTIKNASTLSDQELQIQTRLKYREILCQLAKTERYPLRFWNYIPGILSPASEQRIRYMVFNAGRYQALAEFWNAPGKFESRMATATGVGHSGTDLVIHCLSADRPGEPLNNPRQVAPYHYSKRFGSSPPCFARAVKMPGNSNLLLVGGTAAIRGEDSVYREDLRRQLKETFANLSALICAANGEKYSDGRNFLPYLHNYRELRIYFPNPEDEQTIVDLVRRTFAKLTRLEIVVADLCRPELLVEIEGVAELLRGGQ